MPPARPRRQVIMPKNAGEGGWRHGEHGIGRNGRWRAIRWREPDEVTGDAEERGCGGYKCNASR